MRTSHLSAAVLILLGLFMTPGIALPGPLRLAEVKPLPQASTQRTALEYVQNVAANDLFELASARLALQKSKSAEVRKFASLIIAVHTDMSRDMKTALAVATIHPILPVALDSSHNALMTQLKSAHGSEFDTRYIQQQVDAHEIVLEMHQSFARRGEDVSLKRFAADAETKVDRDLAEAQTISHSLGGLLPRA